MKNKKWLYISSFFVMVYLTVLFTRMWSLKTIGVFTIGVLLISIGEILTWFFLKNSSNSFPKNKKIRYLLFFEVLAISILLLGIGNKFFIKSYVDSDITIKCVNGDSIDFSSIDAVILNNMVYSRYGDTFNNDYDASIGVNNGDILTEKVDDYLHLKIKKGYSVRVVFNSNRADLELSDGYKNYLIKSDNSTNIYTLTSNSVFDSFSLVRAICSYITIFYIVALGIIYLINPKNKHKRFLFVVGIASFGIALFYINDCSILLSPDSYTYIDVNLRQVFSLKPDAARVPVYPLVLHTIRYIFGSQFIQFSVIFQYVIWFISIIYLYKTVDILTKHSKLSMISSVLYAIAPFAVIWNGSILTESLTLSCTLIFLYYIIKYIKTDKVKYGIFCILLSLVLTFLRPTSLIYLAGLLVFIIVKLIIEKCKKCDLICLATNFLCLLLVVFYAICFHNEYGIFSLSDTIVRQNLMVTMREKFYLNSDNNQFISNIELAYKNNPDNEWSAMLEVESKYSLSEIIEMTSYCRKKSKEQYYQYLIKLTKEQSKTTFVGYAFININPNYSWLHESLYSSFALLTFFHIYILVFIEMCLMIIKWVKSKKIPWTYCGLFSFPLVIIVSSFIGTCGEYMRTAACCVPFAYLIFIMLIYDFFIKKERILC